MPAIHLFGRKTFLGGDDLQLPCLLAMTFRIVQLTALLIPIWWHLVREARRHGGLWSYIFYDPDDFQCRTSHMMPLLLLIYSCLSTLVASVLFVCEARLYRASGLGCPTDTQPRSRKVERLLEFKLVPIGVVLCLVLLLGVVTVAFAKTHYDCQKGRVGYDYTEGDDFWQYVTADGDDGGTTDEDSALLWWIAYALLWSSQCAEAVATILTWLQFCSTTSPSEELHHELMEERWAERCTSFCQFLGRSTCFLFGGRDMHVGNYGDVARALTDFMEGDLDLVPSDVVMGFMILQKIQRQRVYQARSEVQKEAEILLLEQQSNDSSEVNIRLGLNPNSKRQSFYIMHQEGSQTFYESTSRKVLNISKNLDRAVLQEGARFSRYQLAIYTWVLYLYGNPVSGLPRLLARSGCGCCSSRRGHLIHDEELLASDIPSGLVVGDNYCKVHKAALMLQAGIDDETTELIYAQLYNSFSEIPYCIIVDHAWKCVVLAIRGTFSLEDCVTDILIDPSSLEEMGHEFGFDGQDQYCHGGVMTCAQIVYRDLERHGLLDKLLLGEMATYPDYTLRVVGHSLGAGTSTLLSYMLRRKFQSLRCINYSPPGCSFTWRMATECKDWCTAFVLDSDLVPRLSLDAMEHLRDEVIDLVGRVKVPKVEVARSTFPVSGFVCRGRDRNHDVDALADVVDSLLNEHGEINPNSDYQQQLESFKSIQEERRSARGLARSISMYPPGRMVHFMKTGERQSWTNGIVKCMTCCTTNIGSQYTPIWVNNDDFNEIVVSPTMGTDHFPNRLTDTMQNLVDECGLDTTRLCSFEVFDNVGLPL
jgi:sn1-specific diacylglycerol lipase